MLLKPQFLSVSEQAAHPARQHRPVQYTCRSSHSMLQFHPQKLAEWIANNYAVELNVPPRLDPSKPWSTTTLNRILQTCIVSDSRGIHSHLLDSRFRVRICIVGLWDFTTFFPLFPLPGKILSQNTSFFHTGKRVKPGSELSAAHVLWASERPSERPSTIGCSLNGHVGHNNRVPYPL
jgi:hypothetical protein